MKIKYFARNNTLAQPALQLASYQQLPHVSVVAERRLTWTLLIHNNPIIIFDNLAHAMLAKMAANKEIDDFNKSPSGFWSIQVRLVTEVLL